MVHNVGKSHHSHQPDPSRGAQSKNDPPLQPGAVADYIWTTLMQEVSDEYNSELQEIQKKYANDPAKEQEMIQALGARRTFTVDELQKDYNAARLAQPNSQQLQDILNDAKTCASNFSKPLSPEQQKGQDIENQANALAKKLSDEISGLLQELQGLNSAISDDQKLIDSLETYLKKHKNLKHSVAKQAKSELASAKKKLSNLNSQKAAITGSINTLQGDLSKVQKLANDLSANYNDILQNIKVDEAVSLMQKDLDSLNAMQGQVNSDVSKATNVVNTAKGPVDDVRTQIENVEKLLNYVPSLWTKHGQECYFDIGSFALWDFMDNSQQPPVLDKAKYDKYLQSLFSQMRSAGINQVDLSFSQIGSIDNLLNGGKGAGSADAIATAMQDYPGAIKEFIAQAHNSGLKVDLSMGGENAAGMTICKPGESPHGQAKKLIQFMDQMGFDSVDFDLEDSGAVAFSQSNTPAVAQKFFETLEQGLSKEGKVSKLTIEGSISKWPQNYLKMLFTDSSGKNIFNQLFGGLNLMLYGNQFYLDMKGDWGIESWLKVIGPQNAGMIHIGFQDALNYADLKDNWAQEHPGEPCPWTVQPGSSPGSAAAQIYFEMQQKLAADGYKVPLGEPFWWPDRGGGGSGDRYSPSSSGGSQFDPNTERDFWQELAKLEGKQPKSKPHHHGGVKKHRGVQHRKKV